MLSENALTLGWLQDMNAWFLFLFVLILFSLLALGIRKAMACFRQRKELKEKIIELQNSLISSQKELEDMKKEKNRQLDPYSSPNTKSLFLRIDKNGNVLSVNDYAIEFFGFTEEELVGRNVIGTLIPPKDSHGQVLSNLIDRIKNNPRLYMDNETENTCKDGKKVWISWTNRIIYGKDGQPEEILIMDTPDTSTAVNVWRFNKNGLGHSHNGYNGPFNDVALTYDGKINASMITTGYLNAAMIRGGTLLLGGNANGNGVL